ncbi:MAG: PLP-dependent aminotransferase family protein [Clostridia bacterium]|jgi:DNA-binding transcriptional MocR family regulator|uniref:MocR-like pyridoxine biosynthesis transcription factor PdxR n=1 Tax=Petroclostridium xylanilyticum TaxID=1792311 RepID=UPI000B98CB3E|nr:PLP-dependent aminotransferase family protein [Petroclostridium xylanilyticum]MBZ4645125.1 PLP-dependent aminotransferase family protein [Clostridia bacterium]
MREIASIQLDRSNSVPLYIQLFEHLKKLIVKGNIAKGSRLPAIRKLAEQLEVNTVTVVNAYKLLEQNGYVYSKTGSGVYVAPVRYIAVQPTDMEIQVKEDTFFEEEDIQLMSRGQITLSENSINFASATPTPDLFPVEDFKKVLIEVLDRDKGQAFGYHESNGYKSLRHSISQFLNMNYSIKAHQDDIQIISGAQQGIDVIAKALINHGDYVLVENPTYTGAIAVFKSRGAKIVGVPIEHDGINISVLEKYIKLYRPKLIYTMPNYQNPTTFCYSREKKQYLLDLAYRNNFFIIEDDFLTDLNFTEDSTPHTLKSLDKYDRVLYIKSFSKVLMPGLRIGFLIAPSEVFKDILQAKHTTDISSSGLIQRAFDLYLQKGIWGRHLDYMKEIYKDRYKKILGEIAALRDLGASIYEPNGGLNLWLTLPEGVSGIQLYYGCAKRDVLIIPGKIFYTSNAADTDRNIRISFAAVYPEQIEKGIEIVYNCINKLLNKTGERTTYYSPLI